MVLAGTIVEVHSLQSPAGLRLNGARAAVVRFRPDLERYEVRLEFEEEARAIKTVKGANLRPLPRLPIPEGGRRGFADVDIHGKEVTKRLCQLLLHDKPGEFRVSEIMFTGYAFMALDRMGMAHFENFYATQMESMGGVLALGNICREADEPGTASAVFALLEGDPMYVDTLILTMACTGEIVRGEGTGDAAYHREGMNGPQLKQLTPDQDAAPYVRTMSEGPVLLMEWVAKYNFANALWAAMERSPLYHLLIQRLLRWVAREAKGTNDGRGLGRKARKILGSMFPDLNAVLRDKVSGEVADHILEKSAMLLSEPSKVTQENVQALLSLSK